MKLQNASVSNFGSISELDIDLSLSGLTLVYGPTGAGKSTLLDIPCWILFGMTAKGGSVDEIRSWQNPKAQTVGILNVSLPTGDIQVYRSRGTQSSQNNLYWTETNGTEIRGKDNTETQRMLEQRLGVSANLYLTGAYASEFSPTSTFFVAKAKDRRALFDEIAVLNFPVKLKEAVSEEKSALTKALTRQNSKLEALRQRLNDHRKEENHLTGEAMDWEAKRVWRVVELQSKHTNFETIKAQKIEAVETKIVAFETRRQTNLKTIKESTNRVWAKVMPTTKIEWSLDEIASINRQIEESSKCATCGAPTHSEDLREAKAKLEAKLASNDQLLDKYEELEKSYASLEQEENPFLTQLEEAKQEPNYYEEQLFKEIDAKNPIEVQLARIVMEVSITKEQLERAEAEQKELEYQEASIEHLQQLAIELRAELLKNSVQEIEEATNKYLVDHFDAEIRVSFTVKGNDSLDVAIQKSGYDCVYTQLSKGQRGLLKLAFSVAVMKSASNRAGIHFDNLYFDEALDGLDAELKLKAFSLFETLAVDHKAIMLVEHATEFQTLFTNKYHVTLEADVSQFERINE